MNASAHAASAERYAQRALDAELLIHLAEERGDLVSARQHQDEYQSLIELSRWHQNAAVATQGHA